MRLAVFLFVVLLAGGAIGQYQPIESSGFADLVERTDLSDAGDLSTAQRIVRFVQVSDAHILDDDAPAPMRVEALDDYITAFSTSAQRPQDEFTDEVLNRIIARINEIHAEDELDFVVNTGDNIDNELENELMRFLDNWEGTSTLIGPMSGLTCVPDGQSTGVDDDSNDEQADCTALPPSVAANNTPLAQGLPWFSAFGNHDGLIQGNVPIEPTFQELAALYGRYFLQQHEYVGMHFRARTQCLGGTDPAGDVRDDFGHGFGFAGARLCDGSLDNDGYYAFDLRGIRFVVLDTVNDDFLTANENYQGNLPATDTTAIGGDVVGGYAEGAIDPEQYAWFQDQVQTHRDQLIIVMAHHTINSMFTDEAKPVCCGPNDESLEDALDAAGFTTGKEVEQFLAGEPHVVAWVGGHTHQHRIEPKGSFWNIESSSLIDMPQEARVIELWATADGKGFLTTQQFSHDFEESRALALSDSQEKGGMGTEADQEVLLWFTVPSSVSLQPQPSLPRFLILEQTAPLPINGTHGHIGQPLNVSVEIKDNLLGAPATDLDVRVHIRHANPTDFDVLLVDEMNLTETAPGTYSATFTPEHGINHFATYTAIDPDGVFAERTLATSWVVVDPDADEKADGKKSPGLGALVPLALAAACIALRRR